jgi:RHS repeat-associated protein
VWNTHYDIFGKIDKISKNEIDNPIRMQGQYEDEETGLYYNRYRYYDPVISAYVSQDPLGLGAGENVYSYTLNSFGWIDPMGLSDLLNLVKEAHSVLDPKAQGFKTTAIGKNANGDLFMSSSDPKVPRIQREWAEQKGINVVNSGGKDIHAEESLIKSNNGIKHIDASRGVCIDCENLMNENGVTTATAKTGKKSKKRLGGCGG